MFWIALERTASHLKVEGVTSRQMVDKVKILKGQLLGGITSIPPFNRADYPAKKELTVLK
jgi:hypothetical protein